MSEHCPVVFSEIRANQNKLSQHWKRSGKMEQEPHCIYTTSSYWVHTGLVGPENKKLADVAQAFCYEHAVSSRPSSPANTGSNTTITTILTHPCIPPWDLEREMELSVNDKVPLSRGCRWRN